MSMARVVITAVVLEGRPKSVVARDYGVSRRWVQVLVARYLAEGETAFEPRSRRPHTSPQRTSQAAEDAIVALRKELAGAGLDAGAETIAWHLRQQAGEVGCPAFSGQVIRSLFMLPPAGSDILRMPLAGSGNRALNEDATDYSGSQCSGRYLHAPSSA